MAAKQRAIAGNFSYPRNQWYVAAYSNEIGETPVSRLLLDQPVVMFRTGDGKPVALFDRCPHRGLPLSLGKRVENSLQCTYHGIRFDEAGHCVEIPSGGAISPGMCVKSYPLVEQWQWVWIWPGDPEMADPRDIPDLAPFGFGLDGWYHEPGCLLEVAANYLLPFENLLDASHITYLHNGMIDSGDVASTPFSFVEKGHWLKVIREIRNEIVSPLTRITFQFDSERAHRTITAESHAPNLCGIRIDLAPADNTDQITHTNQLLVGITPSTLNSCFEFTAVAQNFPFKNENRAEDIRNLLMEDVVAMEAIQRLVDSLQPEQCQEISVAADTAAMHLRTLIRTMLEAESAQ